MKRLAKNCRGFGSTLDKFSSQFVSITALLFFFTFLCLSPPVHGISVNIDEDIRNPNPYQSSLEVKYLQIPGSFQFRDLLFSDNESCIVASTDSLYKISLSSMQKMTQSDWLPTQETVDQLASASNRLWSKDINLFCKAPPVTNVQLDSSKIEDQNDIYNLTCRWYFYALSPVKNGKFWTCFSKQTFSGCTEFTVSLENTNNTLWPTNSSDPTFLGSYPDAPWLTSWKSVNLVSFLKDNISSAGDVTFVGNTQSVFSVSSVDNRSPFFYDLFQLSKTFPVKSFIIGDFQYIFFHDNAYEARSSYYNFDQPDKEYRRFSRVGRVCLSNSQSASSNNLLMVARLVCGIRKSSYPDSQQYLFSESAEEYHYLSFWDVISDVQFDSESQIFYATFNSHYLPKSLMGAAMCAFDKSEIDAVIESKDVKKPRISRQENHLSWELYTAENLTQCSVNLNVSLDPNTDKYPEFLPLKHAWVEPMNKAPLVHTQLSKFQSLAFKSFQNYSQLYITTQDLKLVKLTVNLVFNSTSLQAKTSHVISLPKLGAQGSIADDLFDDNFTYFIKVHKNYIYIGNTWTVYKVPRSLCNFYVTCIECLEYSNDPECVWSSQNSKCESSLATDGQSKVLLNQASSCPHDLSHPNLTYQVTFLEPLPSDQATNPVLAASDITLFCGASFSISKLSSLAEVSKDPNDMHATTPVARWYENSRDVSQSVGKCGTVGLNILSCFESVSKSTVQTENVGFNSIQQTVTGFAYSLLKISAHQTANYTCVFHYSPKDFISSSVVLKVQSRKQTADQLYAQYIEELRQFYTRKCEIDAYCVTDGCKLDNERRFQSCLNQQLN